MNTNQVQRAQNSYSWLIAGIVLLLGLRLSAPTSVGAYIILAIYAFKGPACVIRALLGSWFLTLINPGIFPDVPAASMLRYVVLFACAASIVFSTTQDQTKNKRIMGPATLLLSAIILIQIIIVSDVLLPFILKLSAWTTGVLTLLAAWGRLSDYETRRIRNELYVILTFLIILSLPLMFSNIGFFRNGRGFQGLMNHPQAFGITGGLLSTWAFTRTIRLERPLKWHLSVGFMSLTCVVLSQARTALFSMAIGLLVSTLLFMLLDRKRMFVGGQVNRNSGAVIALVLFVLIIGGVLSDGLGQFGSFLSKSQNVEGAGIGEAFTTSRGFLVDRMITNIGIHPWTGIGFGSPSDLSNFVVEVDPIFGLPIGAPVEKGVGPVAVLEELGVVLTTLFVMWLMMGIRGAWHNGYVPFAIVVYVLSSNMGEYTFFSLGGMGLLLMIFFTGSIRELNK